MSNIKLNLAMGVIAAGTILGCAKYDIQKDHKEFKNLEGIVIRKTDNTNSDTLIYGVRIMTPEGTFEYFDKQLHDSTYIGSKIITDLDREYETLILKKNNSNCRTKYLNIKDKYNNIKIIKE